jgi:hypothetical protein
MPVDQLGKNDAPPQRHVVLKPEQPIHQPYGTRGGQSGTQVNKQSGSADGAQQQNPKAQRNVGSQGQLQSPAANRNKPQGAASTHSHDPPRNPPQDESKKKDKDKNDR